MYQLISLFGITRDNVSDYRQLSNQNQITLKTLSNDYYKSFMVLLRLTDNQTVYLDPRQLSYNVQNSTNTIVSWLSLNGSLALPTQDVRPNVNIRNAAYFSLWQFDFFAKTVNRNLHPDTDITEDQRIDVLIQKKDVNYSDLFHYGLYSVNGYLHQRGHSSNGIIIYDGAISGRIANDNKLGLIDFKTIGKVECFPIKEENIYKRNSLERYDSSVYIKLPFILGNRTVGISLGGILHLNDGLCSMVSDNVMKVDTRVIDWVVKYYRTKEAIDLSSLPDPSNGNGSDNIEILLSDEMILKWFLLSQSFIIVINNPNVIYEKEDITFSRLSGVFDARSAIRYPVFSGEGRLIEYVKSTGTDGRICYRVANFIRPNYLMNTTDWKNGINVSDAVINSAPYKHITAHYKKFIHLEDV